MGTLLNEQLAEELAAAKKSICRQVNHQFEETYIRLVNQMTMNGLGTAAAEGSSEMAAIRKEFQRIDSHTGIIAADVALANQARRDATVKAFAEKPETLELTRELIVPVPKSDKPKFALGKKSIANLVGVHPTLVSVVELAIQYTQQDFTVYDGVRTDAEQEKMIQRGASKTRDSYHKIQPATGYGHAYDLVPIIGGLPKWDWDGCYKIACAVDKAATELNVANLITWGAAWDRTMDTYGGDPIEYKKEMEAYARRHPGPDFLDGPHFQLKR